MESKQYDAVSQTTNFYRRPLPSSCIAFDSEEGKQLFTEALSSGYMNCYFKLAAQFRTQDEPAYCGLSTLVVILNALHIDPGRIWKGAWRWYHEDMLDCCVSLDIVKQTGITLDQFMCIGMCNTLDVERSFADDSLDEDTFRNAVKQYSKRDDAFLALSYSRAVLHQSGDGHFSPLGGYHPGKDLILVLDLARFKYPPHWVSLSLLYEAMQVLDRSTNKPRGYMTLTKSKRSLLVLFRLSEHLCVRSKKYQLHSVKRFITEWNSWMQGHQVCFYVLSHESNASAETSTVMKEGCHAFIRSLQDLDPTIRLLTTQEYADCPHDVSVERCCVVTQLRNEIEKTIIFREVCNVLKSFSSETNDKLSLVFGRKDSRELTDLKTEHLLSVLLMAWPGFCSLQKGDSCNILCLKDEKMNYNPKVMLREEVTALQDQLRIVLNFKETCRCLPTFCNKPDLVTNS